MRKNVFLCGATIVISILYTLSSYAVEYIYPVAHYVDNQQEVILFMHQTQTQETRLWSFNTATHEYEQLLSSQYNPVGVQLLPDNSGFSFLDNGLIKVKNFLKRSPKTIELYEPLYNFGIPQWLDNNHCFFHAKEGNCYGIYQTDLDGQVSAIIKSSSCDYLHPRKVGNHLFFIARDLAGNYYVKKSEFYATQKVEVQHVQNFEQRSLINLLMVTEDEGFVIEHVSTNDTQLTFNCYHFTMHDKKIIFSFHLPSSFFIDKVIMLRDPVSALFPRFAAGGIYFISSFAIASADRSCHGDGKNKSVLRTYFYDLKIDKIISCDAHRYFPVPKDISFIPPVVKGNYQHILIPIMTNHGLLSGYAWE